MEGYALASASNCEGSVGGYGYDPKDQSRGLLKQGEVFLKQAYDNANLQTYIDTVNGTPNVRATGTHQNVSNRWAFAGASVMPRIESPEDMKIGTHKFGKEEYLVVDGNIVTYPRRDVVTVEKIEELDSMLRDGTLQQVDDCAMSNDAKCGIPVSKNVRYRHPNGHEYVYVTTGFNADRRGWKLCEPLHAVMDQGSVQITDIPFQTYAEDFHTYTERNAQYGDTIDLSESHVGKMMNEYFLKEAVRSAERNQELTAELAQKTEQQNQQDRNM